MKQQPAKGKQLWNFHQGLFKSEPTLQPEFYILPGLDTSSTPDCSFNCLIPGRRRWSFTNLSIHLELVSQ